MPLVSIETPKQTPIIWPDIEGLAQDIAGVPEDTDRLLLDETRRTDHHEFVAHGALNAREDVRHTVIRLTTGECFASHMHAFHVRVEDKRGVRDLVCEQKSIAHETVDKRPIGGAIVRRVRGQEATVKAWLEEQSDGLSAFLTVFVLNAFRSLLDTEALCGIRLRDGQDPCWFAELFDKLRRDNHYSGNVHGLFRSLCLSRHADKVEDASPMAQTSPTQMVAGQGQGATVAKVPDSGEGSPLLTVKAGAERFRYELRPKYSNTRRSTLEARISKACSRGTIVCRGKGRGRRIDPQSLDSYILATRNQELEEAE